MGLAFVPRAVALLYTHVLICLLLLDPCGLALFLLDRNVHYLNASTFVLDRRNDGRLWLLRDFLDERTLTSLLRLFFLLFLYDFSGWWKLLRFGRLGPLDVWVDYLLQSPFVLCFLNRSRHFFLFNIVTGVGARLLRRFWVELIEHLFDFFISDVDLFCLSDDSFEIRQEPILRFILVFNLFEKVINVAHTQSHKVIFHKFQDGKSCGEYKPSPIRQNVVPNTDTKANREAVQET